MITIEIGGEIYETIASAAKTRKVKYETFRSWVRRNKIGTLKDESIHGALIKSSDADKYKPVGAGRPRKEAGEPNE